MCAELSEELKQEALKLMADIHAARQAKELGIKPEVLEILKKSSREKELAEQQNMLQPETFEHIILLGAIL